MLIKLNKEEKRIGYKAIKHIGTVFFVIEYLFNVFGAVNMM